MLSSGLQSTAPGHEFQQPTGRRQTGASFFRASDLLLLSRAGSRGRRWHLDSSQRTRSWIRYILLPWCCAKREEGCSSLAHTLWALCLHLSTG
jgi:hypothetical protein